MESQTQTKKEKIFSKVVRIIKASISSAWLTVKPGSRAVWGASRAVLITGGLVYLIFAFDVSWGPVETMLQSMVFLVAAGLLLLWLGQGIAWAIGLLAQIPWPLRWTLGAGAAMIFLSIMSIGSMGQLLSIAILLGLSSLLGAGIASVTGKSRRSLSLPRRITAYLGMGVGGVGLMVVIAWFSWHGPASPEVVNAAAISGSPTESFALTDPSLPGPFPVQSMTYGSGNDKFRKEYGADATIITQPVDGRNLLFGSWDGLPGQVRSQWWGFGPDQLPINGRIWAPEGEGPFPLVLIVHGNHPMLDFSDPGYAYLGELLASRGFIFVSVDQNFINGGLPDLFAGFSGENDARAWLLLEHLNTWRSWNFDPENPFYQRVDLENIALIGHSRGGEAAAVAALFNKLPVYPDYAGQAFAYDFNIRAVVAIAPIDGQYRPSLKPVRLTDVNYFVLHGSNDGDAYTFFGINQYERVTFTPGTQYFKSALYIHRANHGQFNSSWGNNDRASFLVGGFLNRSALLQKEQQEQVAKVYLSAFLEASLHHKDEYLPLLKDSRAGAAWLPGTVYINRFDRAGDLIVANYEEDVDLSSTTMPGGHITAENLEFWNEKRIHSKGDDQVNTGAYLGWKTINATYSISTPEMDGLSARSSLIFNIADALQDPAPDGPVQPGQNSPRQPIDIMIELVDQQGSRSALALNHYRLIQPQLVSQLFKFNFLDRHKSSEPVLQSHSIPLADFVTNQPGFDLARIRAIIFVFNQTSPGSIILDGVGFRP